MVRECFRCKTGIIFDAVMLQQIGLNVRRGHKGEIVLCDIPERIPASPPAPQHETVAQELVSIAHLLKTIAAFPFVTIGRLFRTLKSPGYNHRYRREPIAARKAGNPQHILEDKGEEYEAEEERSDALSDLNDQLPTKIRWRLMELLPMRIKKQKAIVGEVDGIVGFKWT